MRAETTWTRRTPPAFKTPVPYSIVAVTKVARGEARHGPVGRVLDGTLDRE